MVIAVLDNIINERHLLKHPFYQAWSAGQLNQSILQTYAIQYYSQVESFPRFLSRVHTHCPEMAARKVLLENLREEEHAEKDHPSLWRQFSEGLGVEPSRLVNRQLLPETERMVDGYYALAEQSWHAGLCALYAYESQVPAVSSSKIAGLKEFYKINDARTLEFFTAHEIYDVEHAEQVGALIDQYVGLDEAKEATAKAADLLCEFLDGMCREAGIASC